MIVIRPLKCISWWWRTCVLSFTSVSNFAAFSRHQAKLLLEKISSDTKSTKYDIKFHLIQNLTGFILFSGNQGPAPPCRNLTGVETPEKEEKEKEWKIVEEKERLEQQGNQDDSKVNSEISVS